MRVRGCITGASAFFAGVLFFCGLGIARAQTQEELKDLTEIPLEELNKVEVYSASKFSQKVTEAPASITIVTAADIQRYGYRTIADILRSVTGFTITNDRNYEFAGMRGFGRTGDYNTRILILLNGMRLNENVYGGTGIGNDFPIHVDLIEKIEIVRGPGSSLYGTSAFFGTINIITKRGRSLEGGYFSAEAGNQQTYEGVASYGRRLNSGLEMLFSGAYRSSKGDRRLYFPEFDTPATNEGVAENLDAGSSATAYANISYGGFFAQFAVNTRQKDVPTAAYGTSFNDRKMHTGDSGGYLDLKYERTNPNGWSLLTRTFLGAYQYDGFYGYDPEDNSSPFLRNTDYTSGRWWGGELQITKTIAARHHLTAGTEWQYGFQALQRNYDEPPDYYVYLDSDHDWSSVGAYLQGEFALHHNLLLSAGFRHDHYSTFGGNTSPRFGIVYSPQAETTLKLLYGHAFRAPTAYEMNYTDGYFAKTSPHLKPEKIKTMEMVVERYLGRRFRLLTSAYHNDVDGLISNVEDVDGFTTFENIKNVHVNGIEFELEGKDIHGFDGRIGYEVQKAVNRADSSPLPGSPRHIARLNLFLPCFATRGGAGLEMRYVSPRKTRDASVGGFVVANVTFLYKKLLPNLDLTTGIYNVFNKRYSDPAGEEHVQDALVQDGRIFRVRLGFGIPSK